MGIIPEISTICNRLMVRLRPKTVAVVPDPVTWRNAFTLAQVLNPTTPTPAFVATCAVATHYRVLFHPLKWHPFPERPLLRSTTRTPSRSHP